MFQAEVYLYGHWREVPHIDDDGPAGHHPEQITNHVVFTAVPESIAEPWVVLRYTEEKNEDKLRALKQSRLPKTNCACLVSLILLVW